MRSRFAPCKLRVLGLFAVAVMIGAVVPGSAVATTGLRSADDGARIVSQEWLNDSTFDFTVDTAAIGSEQKVRVLVPQGWKARPERAWPVLYAFHGGRDTYLSWTRSSDIATIANEYNVMVVMPEGDDGGYADWWNYGKGGTPMWERFHMSEVPQLVERNFRASDVRACMGNSSGGQGCMAYTARHPGAFRYAASFSGILSLRSPGIPALLMTTNLLSATDPFRIWGIPVIDDANWRAHDPLALAAHLRGVGLFISSGTTGLPGPYDDSPSAILGGIIELPTGQTNIAFRERLRQLHIPVTAHLYALGTHSWPYWQREMTSAWPAMMDAIGATKASAA